jgi:hypothetical protein
MLDNSCASRLFATYYYDPGAQASAGRSGRGSSKGTSNLGCPHAIPSSVDVGSLDLGLWRCGQCIYESESEAEAQVQSVHTRDLAPRPAARTCAQDSPACHF